MLAPCSAAAALTPTDHLAAESREIGDFDDCCAECVTDTRYLVVTYKAILAELKTAELSSVQKKLYSLKLKLIKEFLALAEKTQIDIKIRDRKTSGFLEYLHAVIQWNKACYSVLSEITKEINANEEKESGKKTFSLSFYYRRLLRTSFSD